MTSRVSLLSSTALAAAAIVLAGAPSSAASIDALEKRVKALEKAGAGKSVSRSKKTMKLTVSGHINRMIQLSDNGVNSEFRHTTSQQSRTRVRWIGSGKITDDLSAQAYIEIGNSTAISNRQSNLLNVQRAGGTAGGAVFDERHIDIRITSKTMGKLSIGQGSPAGDGTTSYFNGIHGVLVAIGGAADTGLLTRDTYVTSTGAAVGTATVAATQGSLDGARTDRIRYDTPKFAGLSLAVSHANDDRFEAGLRYGGKFSGVKVMASLSYIANPNLGPTAGNAGQKRENLFGGIGVLLPMGLSGTFAAGTQDLNRVGVAEDEYKTYTVGYRFKGIELGETRLAARYANYQDFQVAGDDVDTISVAVVQILEPLGAELYASYVNFDLERVGVTNIEDIDLVSVGLRLKF